MKKITKDKIGFSLLIFNIIILAISISYFSYSLILLKKIETLLRIGIILFLIIISIIFVILIIKNIFKKKKIKIIIITIISIILAGGITFVGYNINKIYSKLSKITTTTQTYSASIVTTTENSFTSINDIENEKIGILSDKESVDGYQIPQEIIQENNLKNEIIEYDNYIDLISNLLDGKINLIFLPTNYTILFGSIEGLENLDTKTKIIYTKDKNVKIEKTLNSKNLDQPFTMLIMGVDSENEDIKGSTFNGDSLILITFNPTTLNATMLSIPRDTYTPITCFAGQRKNKITHAAWYGESCMISTIENMLDVNIDYYVKINFKGVVKIIDALGGVDVDVPYSFCEQNSNREFGDKMLAVKKGFQTLNGEEALALSRNRHANYECGPEYAEYEGNDFIRGQNQQIVLKGLLNKFKTINSIDTFYDLLDSISQSMETNMSTETILSFYNIAKDILTKNTKNNEELAELIKFEKMYLSGYDQTIVDYDAIYNTGSQLPLYNFVPYQGSINDISEAMKINLGLKEATVEKKYEFDINEPYEEKVIGKGYYYDYSVSLLPSFVGKDISQAQSYCNARGITLNITKTTTNSQSLDGEILTQSLPSGMDAQYIRSMTVNIAEYKKSTNNTTQENTTTKKEKETTIPGTPTENDKENNNTQTETSNETSNEKEEISSNIIPGTPTENEKENTETQTETNSNAEKE